jgi:hypothetical protein
MERTNWQELKSRVVWQLLQIQISKSPKKKADKEFLKGYKKAMEKIEHTMNYLEKKSKPPSPAQPPADNLLRKKVNQEEVDKL